MADKNLSKITIQMKAKSGEFYSIPIEGAVSIGKEKFASDIELGETFSADLEFAHAEPIKYWDKEPIPQYWSSSSWPTYTYTTSSSSSDSASPNINISWYQPEGKVQKVSVTKPVVVVEPFDEKTHDKKLSVSIAVSSGHLNAYDGCTTELAKSLIAAIEGEIRELLFEYYKEQKEKGV